MFLQNSPKTAHKNLTLMAQGVTDVFPENPFSVMLSNFRHHSVHIPKYTIVGLALPSPTQILTLGESAAEAAEAKEGRRHLRPGEDPNTWQEDVRIGAEDEYDRRSSRYCPVFRTCVSAGWETLGPRSTALSSSPGLPDLPGALPSRTNSTGKGENGE